MKLSERKAQLIRLWAQVRRTYPGFAIESPISNACGIWAIIQLLHVTGVYIHEAFTGWLGEWTDDWIRALAWDQFEWFRQGSVPFIPLTVFALVAAFVLREYFKRRAVVK